VRARCDLKPEIVVVLGSGLGAIADDLECPTAIPYADIPHFHAPGVVGHPGRLVLGHMQVGRGDSMGENVPCAGGVVGIERELQGLAEVWLIGAYSLSPHAAACLVPNRVRAPHPALHAASPRTHLPAH
jgi:hypothetical protein